MGTCWHFSNDLVPGRISNHPRWEGLRPQIPLNSFLLATSDHHPWPISSTVVRAHRRTSDFSLVCLVQWDPRSKGILHFLAIVIVPKRSSQTVETPIVMTESVNPSSLAIIIVPKHSSQTVGPPIANAESVNPSSCFMVPFRIGQSLDP